MLVCMFDRQEAVTFRLQLQALTPFLLRTGRLAVRLTRAKANGFGLGVHSIDGHDTRRKMLVLGLTLDAGRALHQRTAVVLKQVHRKHRAQLHTCRAAQPEAQTASSLAEHLDASFTSLCNCASSKD